MYYIFDYGATIDTPGIHWGKLIWHAYEDLGIGITEQQFRDAYVYAERYLGSHEVIKPTDTFRTTLAQKIGLQFEYLVSISAIGEDIGNIKSTLEETALELTNRLYSQTQHNIEDSRKVLETLKSHGHILGLVSNFYGNVSAVLQEFRLSKYFSAVVESATEGIRKPDPRLLQICMERIGAEASETIVVGDHLTKDIQPALTLGCTAVWIKGEPWSDEHDKISEVTPHKTITELSQLLH